MDNHYTHNSRQGIFQKALHLWIFWIFITIPTNVTYIDIGVFDACNSLRRVDVKATTPPTLQDNVFAYCSNELKIYVPKESLEEYQNHFYWKQSNLFSDNQ